MDNQIPLLLAEDQPLVRLATRDALETGGYAVIEASNGTEAMAILGDRDRELSGLVTDIRLGEGPDGWELARHARELNPYMPVVYVTGDSAVDWTANSVPNSLVLQKPFADAQLLAAVSTLLNDPTANTLPPARREGDNR